MHSRGGGPYERVGSTVAAVVAAAVRVSNGFWNEVEEGSEGLCVLWLILIVHPEKGKEKGIEEKEEKAETHMEETQREGKKEIKDE